MFLVTIHLSVYVMKCHWFRSKHYNAAHQFTISHSSACFHHSGKLNLKAQVSAQGEKSMKQKNLPKSALGQVFHLPLLSNFFWISVIRPHKGSIWRLINQMLKQFEGASQPKQIVTAEQPSHSTPARLTGIQLAPSHQQHSGFTHPAWMIRRVFLYLCVCVFHQSGCTRVSLKHWHTYYNHQSRRKESSERLTVAKGAGSHHPLNAWDVSFIALSFHRRLQTQAALQFTGQVPV